MTEKATPKLWLPNADAAIRVAVSEEGVAFDQNMELTLQPLKEDTGFQKKEGNTNG